MKCPKCGGRLGVLDVRGNINRAAIRRRRGCEACGERFTSYEIAAERMEVSRTIVIDVHQRWPPASATPDVDGLQHSVGRPQICTSVAELAALAISRWAADHGDCIDGTSFCGEEACAFALGDLPLAQLRAELKRAQEAAEEAWKGQEE